VRVSGDRAGPGWRLWLTVGVLAYVFFLAALLPAGLVWEHFRNHPSVPAGLTVQDVSGTTWSGSAGHLTFPNGLVATDVSWRFRPGALLRGGVEWQLDAQPGRGHASGRVAVSTRGLRISHARADLDAASVLTPVPLIIAGRLVLDLEHLALARGGEVRDALGVLGWLDAAAGLPEAVSLGDLRAELGATEAGDLRLDIRDQGGPLVAEGVLVLSTAGRYRLEGLAGTRAGADPRLEQALGLLGTPERDGRVAVRLSGAF
jgi:general secretion pathway protein N